jgi:ketosteroid isomerase-like protein
MAALLHLAGAGRPFDIVSLDVTAGEDVALAYALLRWGTQEELSRDPENRLRITFGLRKKGGEVARGARTPFVPG